MAAAAVGAGFGPGQTCWRRLERWQAAGVFDQLRRILLGELNAAGGLGGAVRRRLPRAREKGGAATGPSSIDRRKTGSRHHLISDGGGIPLKVITNAANVNDVTQTLALVDGIPQVAGRVSHPRKRPDAVLGDEGYDSNPNRKELRRREILPVISRRAQPTSRAWASSATSSSRPSPSCTQFKRLAIRWERRLGSRDAFVSLACACWRRLMKRLPQQP